MRPIGRGSWCVIVTGLCILEGCSWQSPFGIFVNSTKDCAEMLLQGDVQKVAKTREERFLGKVPDTTAVKCLVATLVSVDSVAIRQQATDAGSVGKCFTDSEPMPCWPITNKSDSRRAA